MSTGRQLAAVRGAVSVATNSKDAIVGGTEELLRELVAANEIESADVISIMFTATPDLNAEFPAVAARRVGLGDAALMCAREMDVPGALPGVVRVLVHFYTERDYAQLRPVYLGEAARLRADLRH